MFNKSKNEIEELKTEIVNLKIRLSKLEEFRNAFPNPKDYKISENRPYDPNERDELFEQAVRVICQHDRASASLIQRRMQIGFNRAARLLEQLEESGVVGTADGSKPREVLVRNADEFFKKQEAS